MNNSFRGLLCPVCGGEISYAVSGHGDGRERLVCLNGDTFLRNGAMRDARSREAIAFTELEQLAREVFVSLVAVSNRSAALDADISFDCAEAFFAEREYRYK